MDKTKKISYIGTGCVFSLILLFLFSPSQTIDSEKGLDYKASHIIERSENYFQAILSANNLERPFPKMTVREDNPDTQEKIELGRLLFFDPLLSGDNSMSCAHCHHPDLGFSDNRDLSMGRAGRGVGGQRNGGTVLRRGSPTLWNAGFNHAQFWDGRATDLEHQAIFPITDTTEMNQDRKQLEQELQNIPEYNRLFGSAFGDESPVNFKNVVYAVASFERTILSDSSRFDQYAGGDLGALLVVSAMDLICFGL